MVVSRPNKISDATISAKSGDGTAKIISHPRRLHGLIASERTLGIRLEEQKMQATKNIETAVCAAQAIRTDENRFDVDWIVNEFRFVLEEIRSINSLHLPDPEILAGLANRLKQASAALMYGNASASLMRIGRRYNDDPI